MPAVIHGLESRATSTRSGFYGKARCCDPHVVADRNCTKLTDSPAGKIDFCREYANMGKQARSCAFTIVEFSARMTIPGDIDDLGTWNDG